ncbi:putative 3-hydroxybutyryl-CoA dehydratase [delta proteobacterium NaphS2]|nr:putative 3-hydroxybutyryl-CoA dehydratase [delta proteobacterium NaphS2]
MPDYHEIVYEKKDHVGFLTIDRQSKLNALNVRTVEEIKDALKNIQKDDQVRAVVLTGAGEKAFVAGAEIEEISGIGLKEGFDFSRSGQEMNSILENLGKPSIAAVNGLALGGGCELALGCTFRILAENAKLGLPEAGLGVIAGFGGTQRLARTIGKSRALWSILTGDMIGAKDALDMGLANMVVPQNELLDASMKVARKVVEKAPLAVKMALMSVNYGSEMDLGSGLLFEAAMANILLGSKDKEEGINAFLEKRKPEFSGR